MKKNRKIILVAISALIAGIIFGWLVFGRSATRGTAEHNHDTEMAEEIHSGDHQEIWTCSMHPQIRQTEPGNCPICGMELIPLEKELEGEVDPLAVSMSSTAMQLASVSSQIVHSANPVKLVDLTGKVQADERLVFSQSSHIPGRVEKLMVNFTGEYIKKGDVLASVYSPALVTAQDELFEAQKNKETQPQLFNAAKEKLKNWKLTDKQIEQILQSGSSKEKFDILADVSGFVTKKMVNPGDYLNKGEAIYEIADFSKVWVLFDVYESEIPWIQSGDKVSFTVASIPGETFNGTITYLDPVIDPKTRVARARVEFNNNALKLKPEMFVSGTVKAKLAHTGSRIVVPKTAVMWTGKRSLVYVKNITDLGVSFRMREVSLGPDLGDSYIIESGLEEGEEIAVNGTFSIDAAAQLAGKPSMMNPQGGAVATGHNHAGMAMEKAESNVSGSLKPEAVENVIPEAFKLQITKVYETYLKMKNAFVSSDPEKVQVQAAGVTSALNKTEMELLSGDVHMAWMKQLKDLNDQLDFIQKSDDIEAQRKAFARYNLTFYHTLKTFGLIGDTAYYQYCPMAENNMGAYWFSEIEEIKNPYFGDAMLGCGETREVIK